jgi:hypothetical protein
MKWKARKFASYIGQGEKMMIASGTLLNSVLVQNKETRSPMFGKFIVNESSLTIAFSEGGEYFKYVNEERDFTHFNTEWIEKLRSDFASYVSGKR